MTRTENHAPVVILGAGPAGLTAAYELSSQGIQSVVLEKDCVVGGLAQTAEYRGFLFDIGGHRFYTKVPLIEKIWRDVLGPDLLVRERLSRIYYRSHFFQYPLEPLDVIRGLGITEVMRCGSSFLKAKLFPRRPEEDFETWVSNRFGKRLFDIFFRGYTEKVWGIPCSEIRAEWAAQRIRGLTLGSVIRDALGGGQNRGEIKTLIRQFLYPRRGPGMMWSRMAEILDSRGVRVLLNSPVEKIECDDRGITVSAGGASWRAAQVISTLPIRNLVAMLSPRVPEVVLTAASDLNYRDFIVVALMLKRSHLFPDNWIYVHDPAVHVGRIQNYANWSPEMTPDPTMTCLGLEYFCHEGDGIWNRTDADLIALARRELAHLGLADAESITDGAVIRAPKAYPVYDAGYRERLDTIRKFLLLIPNLHLAGRNGLHRYNNQDHSMLTGILAARNIAGASYDLWNLAIDSGYLEEGSVLTAEQIDALEATQPAVPDAIRAS